MMTRTGAGDWRAAVQADSRPSICDVLFVDSIITLMTAVERWDGKTNKHRREHQPELEQWTLGRSRAPLGDDRQSILEYLCVCVYVCVRVSNCTQVLCGCQ